MDPVTSNAQGARGLQRQYGGGGGTSAPRAQYDDTLPEGVDPETRWRIASSDRFRRIGTTTAQRAGADPNYRPGYGRSSNRNAGGSMGGGAGSLTPQAQWDAQFQPHLAAQMQPQLGPAMETARHGTSDNIQSGGEVGNLLLGAALPTPPPTPASAPVLPNSANPPPASPGLPLLPQTPRIQQDTGSQSTVRSVTGLPPGQSASATFVPGQNSPQNLAKRTRPPVDPLAT